MEGLFRIHQGRELALSLLDGVADAAANLSLTQRDVARWIEWPCGIVLRHGWRGSMTQKEPAYKKWTTLGATGVAMVSLGLSVFR